MKLKLQEFFAKKENLYLVLALTFGLIMALFNPPFAGVPDEHAHYWKAWSIAEGYWKCTGQDAIPESAQKLPDQIKPVAYEGIKDKKIVLAKLKEKLGQKDTNKNAVIGGAVCTATPFGYFAQSIGLRFGKLFNLSALADFYLARIANLILVVILIFFAIKIIPFGKTILLIIALFPLTIQQASSLSYDAPQIGFAFLFFAYILRLTVEKEKQIRKKDIVILFALSLFGLNIKLGYFVLSLLVLLIPKEKFKSVKNYFIFILTFLISNVALFFLDRRLYLELKAPDWTNPAEQLKFVMSSPFHFLNVLFETLYQSNLVTYVTGVIYRPGWGASTSHILLICIFVGIILFVKNEEESVPLTKRQRWIIMTVFILNFILIYLALYLGWTTVGASKISGVQGRYLIPLLPLFIIFFYKASFNLQYKFIKKHLNLLLLISLVTVFVFVVWDAYNSYYNKAGANPVPASVGVAPVSEAIQSSSSE